VRLARKQGSPGRCGIPQPGGGSRPAAWSAGQAGFSPQNSRRDKPRMDFEFRLTENGPRRKVFSPAMKFPLPQSGGNPRIL
jgi:hypothetical protein